MTHEAQGPALPQTPDVLIIGAGPAGATAAALLARAGLNVLVAERAHFPRFVIGESLLPQAMDILDAAGALPILRKAGFQRKDGALFVRREQRSIFQFSDGFSKGWGHTYQVPRARFDSLLAEHARASGAHLVFGHQVISYEPGEHGPKVVVQDAKSLGTQTIEPGFVLDASGFGRVLPKLLGLTQPSRFPPRSSLFAHIEDPRRDEASKPDMITISVHPDRPDIWYWLIPFPDQSASVGVVAPPEVLAALPDDPESRLRALLDQQAYMGARTRDLPWTLAPREATAYASDVAQHVGPHFALLGNAGEFLDPIFSSGVTIALKSAHLAANVLIQQHRGEEVDWTTGFVAPFRQGVETFRSFVEAWYEGSLQEIIFTEDKPPRIKQMICSILAGYAWDTSNPYVAQHRRRLAALGKICRQRVEGA